MKYIDVKWFHDSDDYSYRLVSEINSDGYEVRKLEFFKNGNVRYATEEVQTGDTRLGIAEVPELSEINVQSEFDGHEISISEFTLLWNEHVDRRS